MSQRRKDATAKDCDQSSISDELGMNGLLIRSSEQVLSSPAHMMSTTTMMMSSPALSWVLWPTSSIVTSSEGINGQQDCFVEVHQDWLQIWTFITLEKQTLFVIQHWIKQRWPHVIDVNFIMPAVWGGLPDLRSGYLHSVEGWKDETWGRSKVVKTRKIVCNVSAKYIYIFFSNFSLEGNESALACWCSKGLL